jgi:hypothetical protein
VGNGPDLARAGRAHLAEGGAHRRQLSARIPNVPDVYYAQRVCHLVEVGKLESQGNLAFMRFSEVRLPSK